MSPVPSYPQFDLVLLDMGSDLRLFTNDDGPMRLVNDTLDAWILDADLSNETLVWIQNTPAVSYLDLRRCSIVLCESSSSELIFTKNSFYDLDGKVAIGGLKIMWTVHDFVNKLSTKIMFCDLNLNGVAGGCLSTDSKKVINLNLQHNEIVRDIKTTENFGYVFTTINSENRLKLYVVDYVTSAVNVHYDQAHDKVLLRDFTPAKLQQNIDILYLFYNGSVSTLAIQQGNESFSERRPLLSSGFIDSVAVDKNSNYPFSFAYLESNPKQPQSYELKTFIPRQSYIVDRIGYQQMKLMEYNGKSFVTFSKNWYPASMYCV